MMSGDQPPIGVLGLPKVPVGKKRGFIAALTHDYAQFAVYALILLHLCGTARHLFVRKDDLFSRMLPPQSYPE